MLPVISAAWYQGFRFACALAASLSIMRFTSNWAWGFPMSYDAALVNNVLRAVTLMLVAFLTEQLASQMRNLKKRLNQLEARLPVCPECGVACRHDSSRQPLPRVRAPRLRRAAGLSRCQPCQPQGSAVPPLTRWSALSPTRWFARFT